MNRMFLTGILFLGIAFSAVAQPNKVISCYNYLKYGELDKAKEAIDPATTHEKTSQQAKTWYYRGKVYQQIYESQDPNYQKLHPNPLQVSVESFLKAKEFDTRRIDQADLDRSLQIAGNQLLDKGIRDYNDKNYEQAYGNFVQSAKVSEHFMRTDSLAIYNAALSGEKAGKTEEALRYYQKCTEIGYGGAKVYYFIANMHRDAGNSEAYEKAINDGLAKYPEDQTLITSSINLYLESGNTAEALEKLKVAIDGDPTNKTLYFARATLLEKEARTAEAETDYKKAIELDAQYFDAWYNLGAMYFNSGVEKNNEANEVPPSKQDEYDRLKGESKELFKKALPYLEKAEELQPDDQSTLLSLKQLYAQTGDDANYKRINEKLNN